MLAPTPHRKETNNFFSFALWHKKLWNFLELYHYPISYHWSLSTTPENINKTDSLQKLQGGIFRIQSNIND